MLQNTLLQRSQYCYTHSDSTVTQSLPDQQKLRCKRGKDRSTSASIHFPNISKTTCASPLTKEKKISRCRKKEKKKKNQNYIFLFRHFQTVRLPLYHLYICVLFSPSLGYFYMNLMWFLRSDVLPVGKPSEKRREGFCFLFFLRLCSLFSFDWTFLQLRKLIWDQMGTIILHCVVKFYKCWNSL